MDASLLRNLVEIQPPKADSVEDPRAGPSIPSAPERAVPRTYPGAPQRDESIELPRLAASRTLTDDSIQPLATAAIQRDGDLEQSRPATPVSMNDGVEIRQSVWDPYKNRFRFLAACLMNFGNGMNDSAPGALIPYMEKNYDIGYAIVSLIFVGNAFGFIVAALVIDALRKKLGTAKTLAVGELAMTAGYIPIVSGAPFPVVVLCFFLVGFGMSVNIAIGNIFCGSLRSGTSALGVMHGCYGIGGTIGPLIATALVTVARADWHRYYLLTLGLAVGNACLAMWSFWGYELDTSVAQSGNGSAAAAARVEGEAISQPQLLGMFSALKMRLVLLGAIFIFAYQGAEVSISGWVISFLIEARNGDPSSVGYVTAGFWAGITVGRFLLSSPAHRIGEKTFVYFAVVGAAIFEALVWWVPHVVGDAISVAIVGLLLGPVYPCAAAVFMRGMSRSEKVSGMGVISAFGSSGGALAPFTTGILAQVVGPWVLHPIVIFLFAVMIVCWYALPGTRKRSE